MFILLDRVLRCVFLLLVFEMVLGKKVILSVNYMIIVVISSGTLLYSGLLVDLSEWVRYYLTSNRQYFSNIVTIVDLKKAPPLSKVNMLRPWRRYSVVNSYLLQQCKCRSIFCACIFAEYSMRVLIMWFIMNLINVQSSGMREHKEHFINCQNQRTSHTRVLRSDRKIAKPSTLKCDDFGHTSFTTINSE